MVKFERNKFSYTSVGPNPKTKQRDAFIFSMPGDSFYGYEISEFSEEEAKAYTEALTDIFYEAEKMVAEAVEELGLKHNFRRFKEAGVA